MVATKSKKTLYLPDFVIKLLDDEGGMLDGPGVVAGAAIFGFCTLPDDAKIEILQQYRQCEIRTAYNKPSDNASNPLDDNKLAQNLRKVHKSRKGKGKQSAG